MQDPLTQRAYTAVVAHFVKTGRAPHYTELAELLGVKPEEARQAQRKAAESSIACWFAQGTDYVESWAPFSNVPTHYLVTVEGEQKWYGQGGLEALAVRWLFPGTETGISTRCLDCGQPIRIRMRDEEILAVDPPTTVGHMNIPFARVVTGEVGWGSGGSRMNLFRSEEHVKGWLQYDPGSAESIMPLTNWATVFSGPLFRKRLEPDYLSRLKEYTGELFSSLKEMGKTGPFWNPE